MPDMVIKIDVFNTSGGAMGSTSIDLNWPPNESTVAPLVKEWGVWDFSSNLNGELFWNVWKGIFDIKSWDVMWLWTYGDTSQWRNIFILHKPPTSKRDDSRMSGVGRIYEARNPAYSNSNLKWTVKCLAGCYIK